MLSSSKRAVTSLGQGRWNATPSWHPAQPSARTIRSSPPHDAEEIDFSGNDNDFILSILRAKPSIRDTKAYLGYFNPKEVPPVASVSVDKPSTDSTANTTAKPDAAATPHTNPIIQELINPIHRRTALVKLQGPFSDRQLESIARGMEHLGKLGLVSVVVVESDDWEPGSENEREAAVEDVMRTVAALEAQGARARPLLDTVVKLGPDPADDSTAADRRTWVPEAHARPGDLVGLQSALRAGEIPVLPALALDSFCRSVRVSANDVIAALTRAMVLAGQAGSSTSSQKVDMTPLRLMIINREGGIPSYARTGLPHLLVNLSSEYNHICDTFLPQWQTSHPTALSNLTLARTCLSYMPRTSSAVMVSHRSSSSLIGNLITNKPAQSSSLPHALLSGSRKLTQHTPTLFRHGLPIRVIRNIEELDKAKMTRLLEESFGKKLESDAFWNRVDRTLDFAIVAGDYDGGAIVTQEPLPSSNEDGSPKTMTYLDKFAVLPSHQGDGTVDFLWVALHDESYALGTTFARNFIEGSMQGFGRGVDLVWRSRADNPVNKWYYERSSGHLRMGNWVLFWCDAEDRLKAIENHIKATAAVSDTIRIKGGVVTKGPQYVVEEEQGRLENWANVIEKIPSSWKKNPT